ncbi:ABC transporter ATP-binding protein [Novipirellula artificiosorum]|uniref:Putative ABC transporter ATP-binding protein YbhF n=1 Tax=Novipirellula artificiosorum TaxID=2528016 RepID=A0A5C6DGT7_9BACT|nr:ATP-binding cassette domain-containing protein [Novipirellula artificiosorum]TWU36040.1 putative ABC transporter ATP-binding protein YbhF [Novipirellula artificiosorum]
MRLSKRYGDFDALTDCTVRVHRGDIFGLLGPNGAGKTTLIRLLLGYLHPTGGQCRVLGVDPVADSVAVRQHVTYLPGDARLPRHMRGDGVLKFFAEMHPLGDLDRSREVAESLELNTKTRVAFMSTGMRQKLALSVVLGPQTPLLILDEPTANLDPTVRATVLRFVVEARDAGRTVMLSSHVLSEIEDTCNRVAFLRHGRLAHQLLMSDLFQRHRMTAITSDEPIDVPSSLTDQVSLHTHRTSSGNTRVQIDTAGDLGPILTWIDSLRLKNIRFEPFGLRTVYDAVHDGETFDCSDFDGNDAAIETAEVSS